MRILWITSTVFDPFYSHAKGCPYRSSSWTAPLFFSLFKKQDVELGSIVPVLNGEYLKERIQNIIYYSLPIKQGDNETYLNKDLIRSYQRAVYDFKPDIIHIHGVEKNFGLIRKHIDASIPIVCSIQGLVNPCYNSLKYSVATINLNKYRSLKNRLGRGGVKTALTNWKNYSFIEQEILETNEYFIGRTLWDKAQLKAYNLEAGYFRGEELLREPFYNKRWSVEECTRHRIFISSAAYPLKGFHVLLKASAILKDEFPDMKIVVPRSALDLNSSALKSFFIAEDYSNYLKKEVRRLKLEDYLVPFSNLSATEMANEFSKAHVFVLPSFMENSSNALGEAMLVGTPVVVSPVGGVLSIVENEQSSLVFPAGDHIMMAHQIKRIFENDDLAYELSMNAKSVAQRRHDIERTTEQYVNIYKNIVSQHKIDREEVNEGSS